MLKLAVIVAALSGVVFFFALAAVAYYSTPRAGEQTEQHQTTKEQKKPVEKDSLRGFINFLFPDAISIFTFFLVIATIALGVVAGLQIEFLRRAEMISDQSAKAAKESADAAKKAVELSDKTAERQLRAYIGVNNMDVKVYPFEHGEFAFIAHIEMKNFGQTPAYEMTVWSAARIDTFDANPFDMAKEPADPPKAGIAFPGATFNVDVGWQIPAAEKDALLRRDKTVFFWGTIRYTDAFGHRRYFTFRTLSTGQIMVGTSGTYMAAPHPLGYDAN